MVTRRSVNWGWPWGLVGAVTLLLALGVVWVNIELVQLSYSIKELHTKISQERALKDKLEIETMNLLSSYRLQRKARYFNLDRPGPDHIRYVEGPTENAGDP
jgi:cell division protein FtsL